MGIVLSLPKGKYTLGLAMYRQEGFFTGNSRAFRNNNPGNIAWDGAKGYAASCGATGPDASRKPLMAIFPTLEAGVRAHAKMLLKPAVFTVDQELVKAKMAADPTLTLDQAQKLSTKLVKGYCGGTLEQIIYRYCPPDGEGNSLALTEIYVKDCETWMQCKRTDVVTAEMILPADLLTGTLS